MEMLNDYQLHELITTGHILEGVDVPSEPFCEDSPVQPASIDLRIGDIFVPGKQEDVPLGSLKYYEDYSLPPGGTVVVTTREKFILPDNIGGITFPASSVAFKGILITNPGHIDPGFKGQLRFTLINMGKKAFPINKNDILATVLLYTLNSCKSDWHKRRNDREAGPPNIHNINHLSHDFLDVNKRAIDNAKKQVRKAGFWFTVGATVLAAVLTVIGSYISGQYSTAWQLAVADLEKEIAVIRAQKELKVEVATIKSQLDVIVFENRLKVVENTLSKLTNQFPSLFGTNNAR